VRGRRGGQGGDKGRGLRAISIPYIIYVMQQAVEFGKSPVKK
jgi:hypothetical protein